MFLHSIASNMAESELMTIRMQILKKKKEKFLWRKLKKTVVGKLELNLKFMSPIDEARETRTRKRVE